MEKHRAYVKKRKERLENIKTQISGLEKMINDDMTDEKKKDLKEELKEISQHIILAEEEIDELSEADVTEWEEDRKEVCDVLITIERQINHFRMKAKQ